MYRFFRSPSQAKPGPCTAFFADQASQGQQNIEASLRQIDQLSGTIDKAVEVIQSLASESTQIGSVLEVIRSIAEQTNLLALNAAIEACSGPAGIDRRTSIEVALT